MYNFKVLGLETKLV